MPPLLYPLPPKNHVILDFYAYLDNITKNRVIASTKQNVGSIPGDCNTLLTSNPHVPTGIKFYIYENDKVPIGKETANV